MALSTPNPIEALDVPTARLEQGIRDLIARQKAQHLAVGVAAEARHLMDPLDHEFEQIPLAHPELIPESTWQPGGSRD